MQTWRFWGVGAALLGIVALGPTGHVLAAPPAAQAAPAEAKEQSVATAQSPDVGSLWTFAFLESLALERQSDPSPLCVQLYVDLDRALDHLVDSPDWQHLAWQFSRSGIYETLDAMLTDGCHEDLSLDVADESERCVSLREQGRRQLYLLERTERGQAIIHGRTMRSFEAHLQMGRKTGCLRSPHVQDD